MSFDELLFYSSYFNKYIRWRFSYGRMVKPDRIKRLEIPTLNIDINFPQISDYLPTPSNMNTHINNSEYIYLPINEIFDIRKGDGDYIENFKNGNTPLISAKGVNNGIIGYVDRDPLFQAPSITLDRVSGNSFVQLEDFLTVPDDIFILKSKEDVDLSVLFYMASCLRFYKWQFSFYRKVTIPMINNFEIMWPGKEGEIDFDAVKNIFDNNYGWSYLTLGAEIGH